MDVLLYFVKPLPENDIYLYNYLLEKTQNGFIRLTSVSTKDYRLNFAFLRYFPRDDIYLICTTVIYQERLY